MNKEAPTYIDMDEMLEMVSIKGMHNESKLVSLYDEVDTSSDEETAETKAKRRLKKIKSL